ncbi:MAG: polysaccharide biosynthesis C-terminal domain-containing protein [Bacteroidetes bacterium]|nr:polysaccharide biosynthesis C-terminal domain-containing protein [Bacteroidota bacterium]
MKRTLFRRSAFIFAIRFFPIAATTGAGIAFSRLLPPALNGIYARVWIVYTSVFATIACFGLVPFMLTHAAASIDQWLHVWSKKRTILSLLWLALLAGLLVLFFRGQESFQAWILAPLLLVQVWQLLSESYLIIQEQYLATLTTSALYALAFIGVHVLFLNDVCSLNGLFLLITTIGMMRAILLSFLGRRCFIKSAGSSEKMPPEIRSQWLQLGIYDVSQMLFRWVDKVVLSALIAPALFAVYLNGTIEIPFLATLLGAIGSSLLQQMALGDKGPGNNVRMLHTTGNLLARIVFPLFFFLFFFREHFIVFVFTDKYLDSAPLFGISIFAMLLRAYNFTSILQHLNQVKRINWGALLDLGTALGLAIPFYFLMGLEGVVLAFVISSYVQAFYYLHHTAKLMHCPVLSLIPGRTWSWVLLLSGGIIGGLYFLLSFFNSDNTSLFLGGSGTVMLILILLSPYIIRRKIHG